MVAAGSGQIATVELLLANGSDLEAKDVRDGNTAIVTSAVAGRSGSTALTAAALQDQTDVVVVLLQNGTKIEAKDADAAAPHS